MVAQKHTSDESDKEVKRDYLISLFANLAVSAIDSAGYFGECPCENCQCSATVYRTISIIYGAAVGSIGGSPEMLKEIDDFLMSLVRKYRGPGIQEPI